MTMRNGIAVLVLIVLAGAVGWLYIQSQQAVPHTVTAAGDRQIKEDTQFYTIQAAYPDSTRLSTRTDSSSAANARAEAAIEREITSTVDAFKKTTADALTDDEKSRLVSSSIKYALNIAYHEFNSGSFVSYEFDIFQDTGGAHPTNLYKTMMFDLQGNQVALADLFTPGSGYLQKISDEAKKQVAAQIAARAGASATSTVIAEGLAPRAENFSNVVDSDGTLVFLIPPYQAAAYAAGSFEVRIPLSDFKDSVRGKIQ